MTRKEYTIRLAPQTIESLKIAATRLGQPAATIAANAVANFVDDVNGITNVESRAVFSERKKPVA